MRKGMTFLLIGGCLSLIGCGSESGPKLVPVSGVVTMNNKPLEGATVSFSPVGGEGAGAEDVTGPGGNYKAMTRGRSGVAPGKYKVVVQKAPSLPTTTNEAFKDDPFMAGMVAEGAELGKPKKKNDANGKIEGMFDREITAEGGTIDFDVKATAATAAKDAAAAK
jgi:hypothetical protein